MHSYIWQLNRRNVFNLGAVCAVYAFIFFIQAVEAAESRNSDLEVNESPIVTSNRLSEILSSLGERIESIESDYGPYAEELLEPLTELTYLHMEWENYEEAERLLNRRLQIHRIMSGPTSLIQLPSVLELIRNDIHQNKWNSVTDQIEFIRWQYSHRPDSSTEELLNWLDELSSWHLAAFYLDHNDNRIFHYLEYRELVDTMHSIAEKEYAKESELLIPWLYRKAIERVRGIAIRKSNDELNVEARTVYFYRDQLVIVRGIRAIIEKSDDLEAQAMAMIYEADYQKLYGFGPVNRKYIQAKDKFREAGVAEDRINELFDRPTIIPMERFYFTIDEALAEQKPIEQQIDIEDGIDGEIAEFYAFIAWNESLPFARRPMMPTIINNPVMPLNSVLLHLYIGGNGNVRRIESIGANPDTVSVRRHAMDAARYLTFRPNPISWWKSARKTVTLLYMYPSKNFGTFNE